MGVHKSYAVDRPSRCADSHAAGRLALYRRHSRPCKNADTGNLGRRVTPHLGARLERRFTLQIRDIAKSSRSAAVAHVLQLHEDPIGIGEVQLWRAFLRPTAVWAARCDVVTQWCDRTCGTLARLQSEALQRLYHDSGRNCLTVPHQCVARPFRFLAGSVTQVQTDPNRNPKPSANR